MCRHVLVSIQDPLIVFFDINAVEYNLWQSLYSWPNAICCAMLGMLIDKIGLNRMIFGCFISCWIGLIIMTMSPSNFIDKDNGYILLCISRVIVGSTNEALRIALRILVLNHFDTNRYGIAMSIFEGVILIWSALNNVIILQIYLLFDSIPNTLLIPSIIYPILAIPLFSYLFRQMYIDKYPNSQCKSLEVVELENPQKVIESESSQLITTENAENNDNKPKKFYFTDLKYFGMMHWALMLSGATFGTSLTCFLNIQISFFYHMYGYQYTLATILGMIGSVAAIISMIIFGILTDKYGKKCRLVLLACICASTAHALYCWVHINLFVTILSVIIFNMALGIASCVYNTALALIVDKDKLGTAYGIYYSLIFTLNGIGYIIVGLLTLEKEDDVKDYTHVQYYLMSLPVIAAMLILLVWYFDMTKYDHKLEKHAKS